MEVVLLVTGSVTRAQKTAAVLESRGLWAVIARVPAGADRQGCGYGVKIRRRQLAQALDILRRSGIEVRGIYEKTGELWQEVPQ